VLAGGIRDLPGFEVGGGVELRVLLERLDGRLCEERKEGQLDALPLGEGLLGAGPQARDVRDVDLMNLSQLGRDLQRLNHAGRDRVAQAADLLGLASKR
jgi:hypothetical protein